MNTIRARDMLPMTRQEVLQLPRDLTVIFDDNSSIQTTNRKVIYSDYFLDIIRVYPNVSILSRHFVDYVLRGKPLTSRTHIELLQNIYRDVCLTYDLLLPIQKEPLYRMIYKVTNNIYNEVTQLAEPYVASVDVLDFVQIVEHEPVKQATALVTGSEASISRCYDTVTDILKRDPYLNNNAAAIAVRGDMVSLNQVLQCVSPIGRRTEVDGSILPVAVLSNFTRGLNNLYEYIAESRSAAKSLYFSDAKLQDAEYFARRIQLLCMIVEKIDYVDCGSRRTVDWRVTPPSYDEHGNRTYPGDLVFMSGKNYYDDQGVLRQITGDDPNLHGKLIKLRSVLYCQHPDPHKVCEVCFGGLSRNVSRFANLGHLCAATMTQQTTQSVLSIKHLDKSSSGTAIVLNDVSSKYFATDSNKSCYYIRKELADKSIRMTINRDEAIGLVDILHIDNLDSLNPIRISGIECVEFVVRENDIETPMLIHVSQGNKKVMMTIEFLKYLKNHRWEMDAKSNFVFDMADWDFSQPIFKLPEMEYSYSDHSTLIAKVIESNMKNIADRAQPYSPVSTLEELFSLVNTKINVNIAPLEVIVYSTMIAQPGEYRLGRNVENPVLGVADLVIKNRSLGTAYTYEDIYRVLTDPRSFFQLDRPDSVFDVFISPKEYLEHHPTT